MNYTYTIERVSTKQRFMRVRYSAEGVSDVLQTFNPTAFDEVSLVSLVVERAGRVIAEWEAQLAAPDEDESTLGITLSGAVVYTPPVEEVAPEPTAAELMAIAVGKAAADRLAKETSGIIWNDTETGQVFYLDTTIESQNRFSAARIAVEAGERTDGAVWKMADISSGEPVLTFRVTTNAEIVLWAGLVHDYVQKCFEAEALTVAKLMSGDTAADFETEFAAL